jgi:hypothetical protein
MEVIVEIIRLTTDVGFPIVCCAILFILYNKMADTLKELSVTLAEMNNRIDNIEDAVLHID